MFFLSLVSAPSLAAYPDRPITLILPFGFNGDSGIVIKELAPLLSKHLGGIKVEIKQVRGKVGQAAIETIKQSPADGYTLMLGSSTNLIYSYVLEPNINAEWENLAYVDIINRHSLVCVTGKNSNIKDFNEFALRLKNAPHTIRHAIWQNSAKLFPIYFMRLLGLRYDHVSVVTVPPEQHLTDYLYENKADFTCSTYILFAKDIQAGKVRPLFASGIQGAEKFPDLISARKIGLRGIDKFTYWTVLCAHKNTPKPIIQRLRKALQEISNDPAWRNSNLINYGSSGIGKFPDISQFIGEEAQFVENLAVLSKISHKN